MFQGLRDKLKSFRRKAKDELLEDDETAVKTKAKVKAKGKGKAGKVKKGAKGKKGVEDTDLLSDYEGGWIGKKIDLLSDLFIGL